MYRGEVFRMVTSCLAWLIIFACISTTTGLIILKVIELMGV